MRVGGIFALLTTASAGVLESLPDVPEGWQHVGSPGPQQTIVLRIAMVSPGEDEFERRLYQMSDPSHPEYGNHLSREELDAILQPDAKATAGVMAWLRQAGVPQDAVTRDGDWINLVVPVQMAEKLLDTTYNVYQNQQGRKVVRTLQYSVPAHLEKDVDMIQPTTRFGNPVRQGSQDLYGHATGQASLYGPMHSSQSRDNSAAAVAQACSHNVTPACLRAIYELPDPEQLGYLKGTDSGFMSTATFYNETPSHSDWKLFTQEYAPWLNGSDFYFQCIGGCPVHPELQLEPEAQLDTQYMGSIGWPIDLAVGYAAGLAPLVPDLNHNDPNNSTNEPYLEFLTFVLAQKDEDIPQTLTFSYAEGEQEVPLTYRKRVCRLFGQLGARGVSVVVASGDVGVGEGCLSNDGQNQVKFQPLYPGTCPYVTAVGGTFGYSPEQAAEGSTGGFSDTWSRPSYQDAAVEGYLQRIGNQWAGLYNPSGRATPDVAAQSIRFHIIVNGTERLDTGTSAATPVFGGIIALINAQRLRQGKKGLGFLNPFLYSSGFHGLNDITYGRSVGCLGGTVSGLPAPVVPGAGWETAPGWDPVTGYGTSICGSCDYTV